MSKTLQGKYADKLNKQIEELYKVIDAKDKIINEQVLEIARLNEEVHINDKIIDVCTKRIDKAIEYIKGLDIEDYDSQAYFIHDINGNDIFLEDLPKILLEILGDKENE